MFDAFNFAVSNNISDLNTYKILLANPAVSYDELNLYTEKLCSLFSSCSYDILLWTGQVIECRIDSGYWVEKAVEYYRRAAKAKPEKYEPYLRLLENYNTEFDISTNNDIMETINDGLQQVRYKSKIYQALGTFYKKIGNLRLSN